MRFKKHHGGTVGDCCRHNERRKKTYPSNADIDLSRSNLNYSVIPIEQGKTYWNEAKRLIKESGCKTKSNSVYIVETIITASPQFFADMLPSEQREFFERSADFFKSAIGERNIISAIVHMDETTPHMHLTFCPIIEDKAKGGMKLSAKDILGNSASLSKWQTRFHAHMSEKWPDLQRGISSLITNRKHLPVWMFKKAAALDKQTAEVAKVLDGISAFNAGKKKDEAIRLLSEWLPEAMKFTAQIATVEGYTKDLEKGIAEEQERRAKEVAAERLDKNTAVGGLRETLAGKDDEILRHKRNVYQLTEKMRLQEQLISKVPPEVLEQIKLAEKERKERER
jgi:hypothetical protein